MNMDQHVWILQEKAEELVEKLVPVPLCPPQIPHEVLPSQYHSTAPYSLMYHLEAGQWARLQSAEI
jgi:hypothetical protein